MAAEDVLKNVNAFVDGRGYAGKVESVTPPALAIKVEEFRGGGMNVPVDLDLGMEKMEASLKLTAYSRDVLAQFGVAAGASVPFVIRGALESLDGTVTPVVHTMRGRIVKMDGGEWTPGSKSTLDVSMSLTYYKLQHGGVVVQEVDAINMVHIVNGVDRLAAQRAALGL